MLKGQAKRDYQREYMRAYMKARGQVVKTLDVKTQVGQPVRVMKLGMGIDGWGLVAVDADGNVIPEDV